MPPDETLPEEGLVKSLEIAADAKDANQMKQALINLGLNPRGAQLLAELLTSSSKIETEVTGDMGARYRGTFTSLIAEAHEEEGLTDKHVEYLKAVMEKGGPVFAFKKLSIAVGKNIDGSIKKSETWQRIKELESRYIANASHKGLAEKFLENPEMAVAHDPGLVEICKAREAHTKWLSELDVYKFRHSETWRRMETGYPEAKEAYKNIDYYVISLMEEVNAKARAAQAEINRTKAELNRIEQQVQQERAKFEKSLLGGKLGRTYMVPTRLAQDYEALKVQHENAKHQHAYLERQHAYLIGLYIDGGPIYVYRELARQIDHSGVREMVNYNHDLWRSLKAAFEIFGDIARLKKNKLKVKI